ncbi:DUF177 domain-containing protein [bacterium]|nr:DUF177 domain-containing protein [bacterium]
MKLDLDRSPAGRSDLPIAGSCLLGIGSGTPETVGISGSLVVDNLEGRSVVRGDLEARGTAECGRCLEPFELVFDVPLELVVMRDAGDETEDAETLVLHQRDGVVDLSEPVREAILLALPQQRVCRDDCRGLCPQCGADLNDGPCGCEDDDIDPRWDGLPDLTGGDDPAT